MNKLTTIALTLTLFLSPFFIQAQNATIRGFVYEKATGEPVLFTNVYLEGTTRGAATDDIGYFNISNVPPGSYTIVVSNLEYEKLSVKIGVKPNEILTQQLYLTKGSQALSQVTISAERQEMKRQVKASVVKITPKQMSKLPSIGNEPDLAQYMQIVPGVVFTGDQGGQLYIRGGSPIQNKVLLDGMIIYNPFHSIGFFSVFDSDIIRNTDVYTGGFNAEYGGRISSIMDISTRDGNKNRLGGKLSTSTFGSKILLEGPLKKSETLFSGSSSFILSAKNSYLEETSKLLYKYIDTAGLPFNFTDLYGKLSLNSSNGSKVNFFGFRFSDKVNYRAVSDLNWNTYGFGTNVVLVPSGSSVLMKINASYSDYEIKLQEVDLLPRFSHINGFNFGLGFVYFFGPNEFDYGIETYGYKTDYQFYSSVGRKISDNQNTTELSGYLKYKQSFNKKFLFEPGLRIQYYASLSEISPEPRLGMKYNATDFFRIKLAAGLYSQNLISANSDRDVVNLFYGFLSGPDNLQTTFDGKEVNTKLQKSRHLVFGFEVDATEEWLINIEGYYKQNVQLTNINRNKIYDDIPSNWEKPDYLKKDFIIENGDAYGIDILVKYTKKRAYLWAVYSLGYVTRYDGVAEYLPHYDRRHNVNLVGSYNFGKNLNWDANVRWNLGSGFPFTQTQGFYEQAPFTDGISTDYTNSNGSLGIVYADLNGGRLPYYHRLDISVKKTIEFTVRSKMEINFGITNLYNRNNIFYFDRIKHERVDQLPFMPSIGINYSF
ncbi:MAG: TonB-dependent receptor [Bacteroidales bacterium]|nr:TonB-dependent receptor [Bacteroidales bacterium]